MLSKQWVLQPPVSGSESVIRGRFGDLRAAASQPLTGSVPGLDPAEGSRHPRWAPASRAGGVAPVLEWLTYGCGLVANTGIPGLGGRRMRRLLDTPGSSRLPLRSHSSGQGPRGNLPAGAVLVGTPGHTPPTPAVRIPWARKGAGTASAGPVGQEGGTTEVRNPRCLASAWGIFRAG